MKEEKRKRNRERKKHWRGERKEDGIRERIREGLG